MSLKTTHCSSPVHGSSPFVRQWSASQLLPSWCKILSSPFRVRSGLRAVTSGHLIPLMSIPSAVDEHGSDSDALSIVFAVCDLKSARAMVGLAHGLCSLGPPHVQFFASFHEPNPGCMYGYLSAMFPTVTALVPAACLPAMCRPCSSPLHSKDPVHTPRLQHVGRRTDLADCADSG